MEGGGYCVRLLILFQRRSFLTYTGMYQTYVNSVNGTIDDAVWKFIEENYAYSMKSIEESAASDPYWKCVLVMMAMYALLTRNTCCSQMKLVFIQLQGLVDGYAQYAPPDMAMNEWMVLTSLQALR